MGVRVDPAEVEQVRRQPGQPLRLHSRLRGLLTGVCEVGWTRAEVLLEQFEHHPQRSKRSSQLVRRGSHEHAPGLLLLADLPVHSGERAAQVAYLVPAGVEGQLGAHPALG